MAATASLIADIGGTNARFAMADDKGIYDQKVLQCADYPTIVDAVKAYLEGLKGVEPKRAAFAVAGPVIGDAFEMTNHHWKFSIKETQKMLGLSEFELMNDFVAIGRAIPNLQEKDYVQFAGEQKAKPQGTIAVVGPGTGLGTASLIWNGQKYQVNPAEGQHGTMAAKNQRDFDIFRTLRYKYRHVSCERVCSGKGLVNIYNAIRILDGHEELPDRTAEEISEAAIKGTCHVCTESLDKMLEYLGSFSGNMALMLDAFGGVYIAGGIPTKLGDYFFKSRFREEFEKKGRYEGYLQQIPTYLVTHPNIAFIGLQSTVTGAA